MKELEKNGIKELTIKQLAELFCPAGAVLDIIDYADRNKEKN